MHMLRMRAFLLGAIVTCACAPAAPPAGAPAAAIADSVALPEPLLPPAANLSGGWYTGTGTAAEPEVKEIRLHPGCVVVPRVWLIEQQGNALRAWDFPESYNQGISLPNQGVARIAPATGSISGNDVVLRDGTYAWVLRFDSASTHLRGTRNGERFWAVRQVVVRTETCLPPPGSG